MLGIINAANVVKGGSLKVNKLSYEGLKTDLELRKKLTELFQLKDELEENSDLNPIEEEQNKLALQKVNELIGKIRYNAMDKLGIFSEEENKIEKDFPNMSDEQAHIQYPDLQVGKQPKMGEKQKPIEISKGAFSPDAPKVSVEQSESDQNYEKENIGGEHIGQVFQLSKEGSKSLPIKENLLDFNSDTSGKGKKEQELTEGELKLLTEINKHLAELEED